MAKLLERARPAPGSARSGGLTFLIVAALGALLDPAMHTAAAEAFPLEVRPTSLLRGPEAHPSAVLELRLVRPLAEPAEISLCDAAGATLAEVRPGRNATGEALLVPVPLPRGADTVTAILRVRETAATRDTLVRVRRPERGWVLHLVPGFHFDPVWWNTQANYTETGARLGTDVRPGLALVREYLDACRADPEYRVAFHELPYLKTYLEARPQDAAALAALVRSGRCELVGGTYDEVSSTLVSAEATVRNAIYGALFQRQVLRGTGRVFWQLDVFGHDPSFPSLLQQSGHIAGGFARGPFHQWGAPRDQVNFPSEFLWMGPDGRSLLTHYMTGHYGLARGPLSAAAGDSVASGARRELALASLFEDLKRPALTHHVLLPMQSDFAPPVRDLGEIARAWNAVYLSPRVRISTPEAFFAAVRAEAERRDVAIPVVTRDMNPIYTGCPVSFADLKTINRECESVLRDAEIWATLACLEGAAYPWLGLDRAWRQLLFTAHHDAITGSMSDQVYVDLLYAYRDALDLATGVRDRALGFLVENAAGSACTLRVNSLATARQGVPAVGWAPVPAGTQVEEIAPPRVEAAIVRLENEHLELAIDLERGGTLASVRDKELGRDLLRGAGNDVVVLPEHATLPGQGEAPWHLAPTGERRPGTGVRARLLPADPAHPGRVTIEAAYPEFTKRQWYELPPGSGRLDLVTEILDWKGSDELLRVEFPLDVPGGRPVHETAAAVIGRPFAREVDAAKDPWTLDQACWQWVDLGTTCTLEVARAGVLVHRRALGVGEIVVAALPATRAMEQAGRLASALVRCGVTTTITRLDGRRYGDLTWDSNLPDFRVACGDAEKIVPALGFGPWMGGTACGYIERADSTQLPLLVLPGDAALAEVVRQLETAPAIRLDIAATAVDAPRRTADFGVALLNRGSVSVHASADGTLGLNLLRSSTGWPAGVWIDPPARRLPDGAPFETMHGSHRFEYSLVPHRGDWRQAEIARVAQEFNQPLVERAHPAAPDARSLPEPASFLAVDPPGVLLMALKPAGSPAACWRAPLVGEPPAPRTVAVRLWNGTGRRVEAGVRLRHRRGAAWRANHLEERATRLATTDGVVRVPMEPNAYETILCEVAPRAVRAPRRSLEPPASESPSAYWLENRGEGVTGNGIVSIAPEERSIRLVNGVGGARFRVANNSRSETARLDLAVECAAGLSATLDRTQVRLGPQQNVPVLLLVESPPRTRHGRSAITLRATRPGATVTAAVWVEPDGETEATPPFEVRALTSLVESSGMLRATIANQTDGPVSGEAAWIAPHVLWSAMPAWRSQVAIPPRGEVEVGCPLAGGLDSWALLRFTAAGRVAYGEPVAVTRDPERVLLRCDAERLRVRAGGTAALGVEAVARHGLGPDAPLHVTAPEGWSVRERDRSFVPGPTQARLAAVLEVQASVGARDAGLAIAGPHASASHVALAVVLVQRALPQLAAVQLDGDLSDWHEGEFTSAASPLGRARAAVRYGDEGLAFALEVEDERCVQTHSGADLWEGDSVQLGLTMAPVDAIGYDAEVLEYGAALTPDGPLAWCWYGGESGRTGRVTDARVAVRAGGGWTRYEIFLPRAALAGLPLVPGTVLGFSYIANDDDGAGFRGAIQWTRGMSGGKDASLFGDLVLEKE